jgi:photosystem II stability/assembly factor-like uncharacterized protein
LPGQIGSTVKAVKGVSALEAWAATLDGTVLRTLDAGTTWDIIPHDGVPITQVNRMDVLGNDIWIADYMGGEYGMVHSADSGRTWRRERLPGLDLIPGGGPMAVSIVSKRTAWASVRPKADIYRTVDGGHSWQLDAPDVSGPNDLDDICAFNATCAWAVQNISGQNGGRIIRVELRAGQVQTRVADPMNGTYQYEGVTCLDDGTVWVVGFKSAFADPDLPQGVILQSTDGHQWIAHDPPCRTASLWKISFAGARR